MGQAGSRAVARQLPKAPPKDVPLEVPKPPVPRPGSARDVPARPAPPEPQPILEPEPSPGEWDRGDPKYSALVQQVVGKITTRTHPAEGNPEEEAHFVRVMPRDRHTDLRSGVKDEAMAARGKVNLKQLRELLTIADSGGGRSDVATLAKKFEVDEETLRKVLTYVSKPVNAAENRGLNVH